MPFHDFVLEVEQMSLCRSYILALTKVGLFHRMLSLFEDCYQISVKNKNPTRLHQLLANFTQMRGRLLSSLPSTVVHQFVEPSALVLATPIDSRFSVLSIAQAISIGRLSKILCKLITFIPNHT